MFWKTMSIGSSRKRLLKYQIYATSLCGGYSSSCIFVICINSTSLNIFFIQPFVLLAKLFACVDWVFDSKLIANWILVLNFNDNIISIMKTDLTKYYSQIVKKYICRPFITNNLLHFHFSNIITLRLHMQKTSEQR